MDFAPLQAINPDIVAWLRIPGVLEYPVVRGEDNSYYLNHTVQKTYNIAGSIFLDYRNERDFSDSKNIIYGHNMKDGSMFGALRPIWIRSFLENRPVFGFSGRENGLSALFFPAMWFRKMIIHRIRQG